MTHDKNKAIDIWTRYVMRYEKSQVCIHEYELRPNGKLILLNKTFDETESPDKHDSDFDKFMSNYTSGAATECDSKQTSEHD